MRYGAHSFIFTERWSDESLDILNRARDLGLSCFEIGIGDDVLFNAVSTRQRAHQMGLELIVSPGGAWAYHLDLSSDDPTHRHLGITWHIKQIQLAAELGATAYTGALYGHPGVLHHRKLTATEHRIVADGLHQLAEAGQQLGVCVVIEPMSHFRTHVVNTAAQALRMIQLADHPNLHVLLDTYHLITETRDYAAEITQVSNCLWGIHACESDRGAPGGGYVPWQAVKQGLRACRFDGYVIFESYNSTVGDPVGAFAQRRGMLHDVCPDGDAFVLQGLSFMRSLLR